ncbi:MAG: ClpXP protease specificity-enhancing factor SspB [Pseudomonadota bacterium]
MKDDVELDYDYMMQQALRYLMRDVLNLVSDIGDAPGEHHFYIEFRTGFPGVTMPDELRQEYPERMTIVLQHQFEDLTVDQAGFGVTLWFKGKESRLEIPFVAVTSFADPSVEFGLRFEPAEGAAEPGPPPEVSDDETASDEPSSEDAIEKSNEGADVVSLDAFRKK